MNLTVASDAMRTIVGLLQYPVIIILLALLAASVVLVGVAVVEWLVERRHLNASVPELADALQGASGAAEIVSLVGSSGLLASQKRVLAELAGHPALTPDQREALAVNLLEKEQGVYDRRLIWTSVIAKIAPMFGLMGTLIPLGPGLIALGQGDTQTLSNSLLIAFDTTVVGLIAAAIALLVGVARKRWYAGYLSMLEALEECVLEAVRQEGPGEPGYPRDRIGEGSGGWEAAGGPAPEGVAAHAGAK